MYEAVIGLEVHVELKTKSKIFCGCSIEFGAIPNTQVCPSCLGMPGVLPVLNKKVLEYAILAGLSLNCEITQYGKMDKKNYFYPDLPSGYQISQVRLPICRDGYVEIENENEKKRIGIQQIHMEEDAGKLVHEGDSISQSAGSLVDLNRAGVPLIEIVSYPDIRKPQEAVAYLENLKAILQYIGVSDCKMEEGSLRCDGNISVRLAGSDKLNAKTEIKNLNSFKALQKALEYEIVRQTSLLEKGEKIIQETRTWDDNKGKTFSLRNKEYPDYRVVVDTNLPCIHIEQEGLADIKKAIPELPQAKKKRFIEEYGLPEYDAEILTKDKQMADFFDKAIGSYSDAKRLSNWMLAEFLRLLNLEQISIGQSKVKPKDLADLLKLVDKNIISSKIAKQVFEEMFASGDGPEKIIEDKNLGQISDEAQLAKIIDEILEANPKSVEDYLDGHDKAIGFLVGQIMQKTRGQANPQLVNQFLRQKLKK